MAVLALLSIGAVLIVPSRDIDNDVARGLDKGDEPGRESSSIGTLARNRQLLMFAVLAASFHLSNAAMLPSVGQLLTHQLGKNYATTLIAICIVAAQCVMVPTAILVGHKADQWGRKPIFLAGFGVLTVRGVLYTIFDNAFWLAAVQCLDGVGAGIYGALFPIVVADLTRGTGHFNIGQGAVATAQGVGAASSASLAGVMIVSVGFSAAFLTLAAIAASGFALFLFAMPETRALRASAARCDNMQTVSVAAAR